MVATHKFSFVCLENSGKPENFRRSIIRCFHQMILYWLARWVAKPIAMQIPEMVQCPLLRVCTICGEGLPSSRAVFDGHWAFPWGVEGELIPGKTWGPLEVGVPPFCLAPHTPASHPPCALGGCVCRGSSISTLLCIWRPFCPHFFGPYIVNVCSMQGWLYFLVWGIVLEMCPS